MTPIDLYEMPTVGDFTEVATRLMTAMVWRQEENRE